MDEMKETPIPHVIDSRNISQDRLRPNTINSGELLSQKRQDEAKEQERALKRFNLMSLAAKVTVTLAVLGAVAAGGYEANQLISDAVPNNHTFSAAIDRYNNSQPNPAPETTPQGSHYDSEAKRWIADKYYDGKVTVDIDSDLKFRGGPTLYNGNEVGGPQLLNGTEAVYNSRIVKINGREVSDFSSFTVDRPEILTNEIGEKFLVFRNSDIYTGLNADGTKHYEEKDTFVFVGPATAGRVHFLNGDYQSGQKNFRSEDSKKYGIIINGTPKLATPTPTR
ncbi:MAG TPA: hypothetical protein VHE53_01735 [Patescibacteria group bacterium]|nr:hypothetical protein [Patescibacteria group bacterium]